jgi:hypothetical protein
MATGLFWVAMTGALGLVGGCGESSPGRIENTDAWSKQRQDLNKEYALKHASSRKPQKKR